MNKIISDISDYIFISDEPEKVDAIFLTGGSHPEQPEYAADLYRNICLCDYPPVQAKESVFKKILRKIWNKTS